MGDVALRVRDLLRQIAAEHELEIVSGKVARDHVHLLLSYRPNQHVSQMVQWLKGISSRVLLQEFPHLKKKFWGRHFWARGYLAVSSGTVTDEMIRESIEEQEASRSQMTVDFQSTIREPLGFKPRVVQCAIEKGCASCVRIQSRPVLFRSWWKDDGSSSTRRSAMAIV